MGIASSLTSIGSWVLDPISSGVGFVGNNIFPSGIMNSIHNTITPMFGQVGIAASKGTDTTDALLSGAQTDAIRAGSIFGGIGLGSLFGSAGSAAAEAGSVAAQAGSVAAEAGSNAGGLLGSMSVGSMLKLGAAGVQAAGAIRGYQTTIEGARDEADLLYLQAQQNETLGAMKTEIASGEAGIAAERARMSEREAEIAGINASIAQQEVKNYDTRIGIEQSAGDRAVEGELKKVNGEKGKVRTSAAGRGIMLDNRAESVVNMEEQDIAEEAAWSVGKIAEQTQEKQMMLLEQKKIASKSAMIAKAREGLAYQNASIAYKNAGLSGKRVGLTATQSAYETDYLKTKARAVRRSGNLRATDNLISGLANAAVSGASVFA